MSERCGERLRERGAMVDVGVGFERTERGVESERQEVDVDEKKTRYEGEKRR